MRVALLCYQWETAVEEGMIFGVPAEQQQCATSFLQVYFPSVIPDNV